MELATQSFEAINDRWVIRKDLQGLEAIEEASFSPENRWGEDDFYHLFYTRIGIGKVVELESHLIDCAPSGFWLYSLHPREIRIHNLAVLPSCRGRGLGRHIIEKLREGAAPRQRKLLALVPKGLEQAAAFFEHLNVEVWPVSQKEPAPYVWQIIPMGIAEAAEIQAFEFDFRTQQAYATQELSILAAGGNSYGIMARDAINERLLGFILFQRYPERLLVRARSGIVVHGSCRGNGVSTKLIKELMKLGLPITFEDVEPNCGTVPALIQFRDQCYWSTFREEDMITLEWNPETVVSE